MNNKYKPGELSKEIAISSYKEYVKKNGPLTENTLGYVDTIVLVGFFLSNGFASPEREVSRYMRNTNISTSTGNKVRTLLNMLK